MKKNKTWFILSGISAFAGFLPQCQANYALGSAGGFAVLGGSTVTSTGNTVLNGNLGVSPGTAITGFGPGIVNGTTYAGGAVAQQAQVDALVAYNSLMGMAATHNLTGQDLGGMTLTPGVYDFSSSAQLTGTLTLNALGDPHALFVFQIGSTLTTASASSIHLENGANANGVAWQVGSSATLGTGTSFDGTLLASASITMTTGASLTGHALALTGAVTLDDNAINTPAPIATASAPEPKSFLSGALLLSLFGVGRWLTKSRRQRQVVAAGPAN